MTEGLLSVLAQSGHPAIAAACLDAMPYDELGEIDLVNDRCRNIHHAAGKYFVPITDGSLTSLYDYTVDNMVHPDDRNVFAQLFDPDTLAQRLAASAVPGVISARFRYRLQAGGWRWTEVFLLGDGHQGQPAGIVRFYIIDIENIVAREQNASLDQDGHPDRESLPDQPVTPGTERDERTGLLRERSFLARIRRFIEGQPSGQWCLLAIDIDHFQLFNEWYGREQGDFLLAEIGAHLKNVADEVDGVAGYLGQDDFCLLAPFDKRVIDGLLDDLSAIVTERSTSIGFVPAFGISLVDGSLAGMDLLDQARFALADAKADFLRIDDSGSAKGVRILESVISMARLIDLPIICEGVETDEQVEMLKQRGCRFVQGYRFFRPMNVEDFEALIADENMIDAGGFDDM